MSKCPGVLRWQVLYARGATEHAHSIGICNPRTSGHTVEISRFDRQNQSCPACVTFRSSDICRSSDGHIALKSDIYEFSMLRNRYYLYFENRYGISMSTGNSTNSTHKCYVRSTWQINVIHRQINATWLSGPRVHAPLHNCRPLHYLTSQWRHNERDDVSDHRRLGCLLDRLLRPNSKKTSNLRVTGVSEGNSPVTDELPTQRASDAENVSIWCRHHALNAFWCNFDNDGPKTLLTFQIDV